MFFKQDEESHKKFLKAKEGAIQGSLVFFPLSIAIGVFFLLIDFSVFMTAAISVSDLVLGIVWGAVSSMNSN